MRTCVGRSPAVLVGQKEDVARAAVRGVMEAAVAMREVWWDSKGGGHSSVQSWPYVQSAYVDPGPPSSQMPSSRYAHVCWQIPGW
eukprot:4441711-Prymnesium_polylepis.1